MLLDSNIILYAYQEKYADLREFIKQHNTDDFDWIDALEWVNPIE